MLNEPREFFAKLNNPRRQNKNLYYPLENIIFIALTAFICCYNDWFSVVGWVELATPNKILEAFKPITKQIKGYNHG